MQTSLNQSTLPTDLEARRASLGASKYTRETLRQLVHRRLYATSLREDRCWFIDSIQDVCLRKALLKDCNMTEADLRQVQW